MELDNKHRAGKIKLINMLIPLLVVSGIAMIYLVTDIREVSYAIFGALFLVLYIVFLAQIKPTFISVFVGPELVRFRFATLSPFNASNRTIQLKPEQFNSFEVHTKLKGLKKQLILFINSPSGLAKYPPISMSGLDKMEIEKITNALQLLMAMNKAAQKEIVD